MNGFGVPMQFTEFNDMQGAAQMLQQPQQVMSLDKEINKERKERGISEEIFNEVLTRVELAFGVKDSKNLRCKITVKLVDGVWYEAVYREYEDDDYFNPTPPTPIYVKKTGKEVKEVILSLGKKSITYNLYCGKLIGDSGCSVCHRKEHYFTHGGSCKDYALSGVVKASGCTLCELNIEHPEKISEHYCPVLKYGTDVEEMKTFCERFLVDVLYKIVSGLDFLSEEGMVKKFDSDVKDHMKDWDRHGTCTICKEKGRDKCRFAEDFRIDYLRRKGVINDRQKWREKYLCGEFWRELQKNSDYKDEVKEISGLLQTGKEQDKKTALKILSNREEMFDNLDPSVYKQCVKSLKIIVENMVKIDIVT